MFYILYIISSTQGFLIPCGMPDWRRWRLQRSSAAFSHCEVVDLSLVYIRQWCNILKCPSYIQTSWKSCIGTGTAAYCQPSSESWVAGIYTWYGRYSHLGWLRSRYSRWLVTEMSKKNCFGSAFFFEIVIARFLWTLSRHQPHLVQRRSQTSWQLSTRIVQDVLFLLHTMIARSYLMLVAKIIRTKINIRCI